MDLFRMFGQPGGMLGMGGGMGMGMAPPMPSGPFKATYRCYPVVMMANKGSLESGDKIILPASALDTLARLRVTYPMMFSLVNPKSRKESKTHCGVMEFSAEEGSCFIPYWMMQNLLIESGGLIEVTNVSLRKGTYVKLQPHSVKFTQLHNPRVVLERALRNFSCLTKGDTIAIQHGNENFYLDVKEVRPENAVSIIETDVNVDFEAALDAPAYAASSAAAKPAQEEASFSSAPSTNITAPSNVTAAERDFSSGGWGSSGQDEPAPAATASSSSTPTPSSGSDYFSKLGSGNRLSTKGRKSGGSSTTSSAQPSPSPSPNLGPSSITSSSSLNSLSSLRATGGAPARPQSALAGRAGGYSLAGGSSSSSSAVSAPRPTPAASPALPRPTSAVPAQPASGGLTTAAGKSTVIERQGQWNYHYEVDGKGGKRLLRRLPVKDEPAKSTGPASSSSSSSSTPAPAVSGLAALGPGHRLK